MINSRFDFENQQQMKVGVWVGYSPKKDEHSKIFVQGVWTRSAGKRNQRNDVITYDNAVKL